MLTEAQRKALWNHSWTLTAHLNFGGGKYVWSYRCATLDCHKRIYSQKGIVETTYFIDDQEFDSIEELVAALQEQGRLIVPD